jgi:hypothetical protein
MRSTRLLALALIVAVAGCGGDGDEDQTTVSVTQTTTVTETAAAPERETTTSTQEDPQETPDETPAGCADAAGNEIDVVGGDVPCEEARATAAGYDTQGARVQQVGPWTCEGGNAATRPVIFTCSQSGREFVVRESG